MITRIDANAPPSYTTGLHLSAEEAREAARNFVLHQQDKPVLTKDIFSGKPKADGVIHSGEAPGSKSRRARSGCCVCCSVHFCDIEIVCMPHADCSKCRISQKRFR